VWGLFLLLSVASAFEICVAQPDSSQQSTGATIQGTIVDGNHKAVAHALVRLESQDAHRVLQAVTDANGAFLFSALPAGSYRIASELNGLHNRATDLLVISTDEHRRVDLVLESSSAPGAKSNPSSTPPADAMQFADQPNFTVAGVTDWTAAGGHGSDARLRTSEDLTRATVVLKPGETSPAKSNDAEAEDSLRAALAKDPHSFEANHRMGEFCLREKDFHEAIRTLQAAYEIDPSNSDNEYDLAVAYQGAGQLTQARDHAQHLLAHAENANAHRLLGELDEELGEPLLAVNEDEKAVRVDPSEENYFQWGSELLTHRAVRPAIEVFGEGAKTYPNSSRMLAALGAALFAGGRNDEAALHLCEAADLSPADAAPYVFLGKIDLVAPTPIACVEPRLARFLEQQPESALANYYYGMTLWKAEQSSESKAQLQRVEALLAKAVSADPKFEDALLQLGILYFSESNFKQAADCFQRAVAADPGSSAAHYRLGMAYARIGEHDKSQAEFARYRELDQQQAAAIEQQRKEIKQFLVVLKDRPAGVN
jgi:tetratricopeptide (TPR) repeat protein